MSTVPRRLFLPQGSAGTLSFHPLAQAFPPLSVKEFEALVADIEAHGLREAITLYEGQILDGVHRYSACCKAKVEPWAVDFEGDRAAAVAFVISKNALRRHLTPAGKRGAIAALLQLNPEKSDRQIAKIVRASPTTVGATRSKMEAAGDVSKVDTRRDTKGRRQVARKPRPSNRATKKGRKSKNAPATTTSPAPVITTMTVSAPTATDAAATMTSASPPTTDAAEPTNAGFDLIQGNPWELARTIVAKIDAKQARNIACAILDGLSHKLNHRKSIGEFMEEKAAADAKLQDEKQRLKLKCLALEGEVQDLKAEIQKLKAPSGNDADAAAATTDQLEFEQV
jgi:hypothetical protein